MEKGTGVKENYGKYIFDIDINPCYVRKTKAFFPAVSRPKILKSSISLIKGDSKMNYRFVYCLLEAVGTKHEKNK